MKLSQKCQYALAAIFELARQGQGRPLTIGAISEAQQIPPPFLQGILRDMKGGGFVESRRGKEGGYILARDPRQIRVGDVIRFIDGDLAPVDGLAADGTPRDSALRSDPFFPVWQEATRALQAVYDNTTIADIVEQDRMKSAASMHYVI